MANRLDLQDILESIIPNVYFQPPENLKMVFPCFIYKLSKIQLNKADNLPYMVNKCYTLTYIHYNPDDPLIEELLYKFKHISHDRQYVSNGKYYDVYTLYF